MSEQEQKYSTTADGQPGLPEFERERENDLFSFIRDNQDSFGVTRFLKSAGGFENYRQVVEWIAKNYPSEYFDKDIPNEEKAAAMMGIIEYGAKIGLGWSEALGLIFVSNGKVAIKGDLAMSLIMGSEKLLDFRREERGTMEDMDYAVWLSGKRQVAGGGVIKFESTFSIKDAVRLGLYHPKRKFGANDFWMMFPKRMVYYRALGPMVRDYWSDVLHNAYIHEELVGADEAKVVKSVEKSAGETDKETNDLVGRVEKPSDEPDPSEPQQDLKAMTKEAKAEWDKQEAERKEKEEKVPEPKISADVEIPDHIRNQVALLQHKRDEIEGAENLSDMVDLISKYAPHLAFAINQIPGRRTKKRTQKMLDIFCEDPRQISAYMVSEYAMVDFKYDLNTVLSHREEGGRPNDEEQPENTPNNAPEDAPEDTPEDEHTYDSLVSDILDMIPVVNVDTGMRDVDGLRDLYGVLDELNPSLTAEMNRQYDKYLEKGEDEWTDFEDFMLTCDSEALAICIVDSCMEVGIGFDDLHGSIEKYLVLQNEA